jgi:myosin heavy subunit
VIDRLKKDTFTIVHTARKVDYFAIGFCEKNKDELSRLFKELINDSSKK